MVVRFQTCYINSTEDTKHGSIWKNQQPATVFPRTVLRHYACYRSSTNNKLTLFQKVFLQEVIALIAFVVSDQRNFSPHYNSAD